MLVVFAFNSAKRNIVGNFFVVYAFKIVYKSVEF